MAWYNSSWDYRQKLTLDTSELSSSVTNDHAIMVRVDTNTDFWANVDSAGADVRFTSADGTTLLDYHFEKFTDDTEMIAWVEVVDTFDASTDIDIYMYYGNSGASDDQDEAGTYTSDIKAIYHMTDATDGTGNYDGTNHGASTNTSGNTGGCYSFDGTNDYISFSSFEALTGDSFSISSWVYIDVVTAVTYQRTIFSQGSTSGNDTVLHLNLSLDGYPGLRFYADDLVGTTLVTDDSWNHIVGTYDASDNSRKLYLNGVEIDSDTASADFSGNSTTEIGRRADNAGEFYNDKIDETKIFGVVLSADEVKLLNLSEGDSLVTFGSQESKAVDNDFFSMSLGCNF